MSDWLGRAVGRGGGERLQGTGGFEAVRRRVSGSDAHVLASGIALARGSRGLDPNQINLLLDALDEVYRHIIVAGRNGLARQLFETIEGRFDAGVVVTDAASADLPEPEAPGTFLGFEVSDLEIIHFHREAAGAARRGSMGRSGRAERRAS